MKHLKLFENEASKAVWIVIGEDVQDPLNNHLDLFDNEESAKNFFLNMINENKQIMFETKHKSFTDADLILTITEAEKWANINSWHRHSEQDYRWYYYKTYVESEFELPERLKIAIEQSKYNL